MGIDRQKRIARAQAVCLLQRLQPAFRLAADRHGISEPGVAERKAGIEFDRLRQMLERELGTPPARVTESDHEVTPGVFIVEHHGRRARSERPVGEFTDRPPGV